MKLIEFLEENGIEHKTYGSHHHTTPGRVNIDCPFCSPGSSKYRLGITLSNMSSNCWVCGRLQTFEVFQTLLDLPTGVLFRRMREIQSEHPDQPLERTGTLRIPKGVERMQPCHRRYLRDRGFKPSRIERLWGVKGITLHSRLSWRLFIPIFHKGAMVSWTTRSIRNNTLRYVTASPQEETIHHKKLLYGEDYCRNSIVVCEGPTDVWRIGPGAVATFGTVYLREQIETIAKYPVRAICFDSTPEAQRAAKRLCDELDSREGETYNVTLAAADPGDAEDWEVKSLRERFLED